MPLPINNEPLSQRQCTEVGCMMFRNLLSCSNLKRFGAFKVVFASSPVKKNSQLNMNTFNKESSLQAKGLLVHAYKVL